MPKALIRVIILNYNQSKLTIECVASVLLQTYSNFEVIVVDNNSRMIELDYLEKNLQPNVILLRSSINVGYAAGNNLGCTYKGNQSPNFIMILNNDTILRDPNTLEILTSSFIENGEKCAIVSPLIHTLSSGENVYKQIQGRRILNNLQMIIANSAILSKLPFCRRFYEAFVYKNLMPYKEGGQYEVDCISGAAFLFNSKFMVNEKIFDENTFLYFEEIILGQQLKNLNLKSFINTNTIIEHYHGATTGKRGKSEPFEMFLYSLNSELYFYKAYRGFNKLSLAFLKLLKYFEFFLKKVWR